jgi:hypothetical protein
MPVLFRSFPLLFLSACGKHTLAAKEARCAWCNKCAAGKCAARLGRSHEVRSCDYECAHRFPISSCRARRVMGTRNERGSAEFSKGPDA